MRALWLALASICVAPSGAPAVLPEYSTAMYRLPNGVRVVVQQRQDIELVAVNLTVASGAADDPPGLCGLAHLLEHASVTGTLTLGSRNPAQELRALRRVDEVHRLLSTARGSPEAQRAAVAAEQEAARWSIPGEIAAAQLEMRGVVGINAVTTARTTNYFARVPAAHLEYWMHLEAERLERPLFRHFYRERAAVLNELARSPLSRIAGARHGPLILRAGGCAPDVEAIDRVTALEHFRRLYRPEHIVLSVVGPVTPAAVRSLAARHFGALASVPHTRASEARVAPHTPRDVEIWRDTGAAHEVWVALRQESRSADDWAGEEILREFLAAEDLSPFQRGLVAGVTAAVSRTFPFADGTPAFVFRLRGDDAVHRLAEWLRSDVAARGAELEAARRRALLQGLAVLADPAREAMALGGAEAVEGGYERVARHRRALAYACVGGAELAAARWAGAMAAAARAAPEGTQ